MRAGDFVGAAVCPIIGGWFVGERYNFANGSTHEHTSLRYISKGTRREIGGRDDLSAFAVVYVNSKVQ